VCWNFGAFLVLLESPWRVRFNRVYFTIFRAKLWKDIIFEWILLLDIQKNCENWVWNENLVHIVKFRNLEILKIKECVHIWLGQ
jgi:hypothetical protein